jgi:nucleotide-binding universal stress UspA family protein
MYKHILVAVDGSSTSDVALGEAINLARALNSQIRLVHVVDKISASWYSVRYANANVALIWDAMVATGRNILTKAADGLEGIEHDTKLIEIDIPGRRIPEAIADEARGWPADLNICGTHGRTGVSHLFLGSVAEGIVRLSTKPVLLVRNT